MSIILSPKLRDAGGQSYMHWCPGCKSRHMINVGEANSNGARWSFDGNVQAPSFSPSVHISVGPWDDEEGHHPKRTECHYFLTGGQLQFLSDCAHELAGQTVELPDFPEWSRA
jgi:hypothetical protein